MGFLKEFKQERPGTWQAVMYALLGCVASAVELASFALFNYILFSPYKTTPFHWWLFDYGNENGGLCYFLSLAVSFALAQAVNFVLQRKATFKSNNDPLRSAVLFALMMTGIFVLQLWLPTVLRARFAARMGADCAELTIKLLSMFLGFVITYPLNKYVVMRRS